MKLYTTCYIVKTIEPGQLLMQFALTDRENVKAFLLKLKSSKSGLYQDLGVIFETEKKNRSLTQNSSYWMIVGFLTEAIYGDRKEESMGLVHEGLLHAYAPRVTTFKGDVPKRSS